MSTALCLCVGIAVACCATPARAHYEAFGPSGGTVTSNPDFHYPMPYSSNIFIGGYGGGGPAMWGFGQDYAASCTGTITTTYVWISDTLGDKPPPAVIIVQGCTAQVQCSHVPGGGYSSACDNGLNDPAVFSTNGFPFFPSDTFISAGSHSKVKQNPGQSFTITCSPNVSLAGQNGSGFGEGVVSVNYGISVYSVTLDLNGTTKDDGGADNILIGQGCSAGFNTIAGVEFRNTQWSVNGDTFRQYDAHGIGSGSYARVMEMPAADWNSPSPTWYWRSDGDGTVSGQVDVYDANGYVDTIKASRPVTVWCPYYYCNIAKGNVWVYADSPTTARLSAGIPSAVGISWTGNVVPEDLFTNAAGGGLWSFTQIWHPGRSYTDGSGLHTWSINGQVGLDDSYPYAPDQSVMLQDNNDIGWADNHTESFAYDTPSHPLVDSMSSFSVSEQFETYMMYRPVPNSVGNQWVPLHRVAWQWNANVTRPGNSWMSAALPWLIGPVTSTEDARCTTHPVWNQVLVAPGTPFVP